MAFLALTEEQKKDDNTHQICKECVCEGGEHDWKLSQGSFIFLICIEGRERDHLYTSNQIKSNHSLFI